MMRTGHPATRFEALCEGIIEAGWLLALGVVPLLMNIYSQRTYEPDKAALVRSLAVVMLAAWLCKVVAGGRIARPMGVARDGSHQSESARRSIAAHGWLLISLVAVLGALLVIGSVLSIDPRLSWLGSYARAQGTLTELSYLVVFAAVAAHLRTWSQWRRIVQVVVVVGTTVALYAIFQALGLDPIETTKSTRRVYSTLGNAIFLGAFLIMTVFLTAVEAALKIQAWRHAHSPEKRRSGAVQSVVLVASVACQLTAVVLSQSRGPFLGLLAGIYVVVVYGLLSFRASPDTGPSSTSAGRRARWAVPAVMAAVLIGLLVLIALNARSSRHGARGLDVPYLGRLADVLDPESRTIKVRLLIWRAVVDLMSSSDPLTMPTGEPDPLDRGRNLVGYGPETFALAINRHIPPELGRVEQRTKTPDRAHNDLFDRLVMSGAVGAAMWLAVYGALLTLALRVLGFVRNRRDAVTLWVVVGLGATVGAVLPWLVSGQPVLSGVGLPVGLVTSVAVFLTGRTLVARGESPDGDIRVRGIALALLAATVAHVVEIHVGIAITSTRLYFWAAAAVLLVVGSGWLRTDVSDSDNRVHRISPASDRKPVASRLAWPLLVISLCLPWVFALTLAGADTPTLGEVLAGSWWDQETALPSVLLWLVAATVTLAAVVVKPIGSTEETADRQARRWSIVGTVVAVSVTALIQAAFVTRLVPSGRTTADVVDAAGAAASQYAAATWVVIALSLAVGGALGVRDRVSPPMSRRRALVAALLVPATVATVTVLVDRVNIDPIRADGLLKSASAVAKRGGFEAALRLLERARRLAPHEPMYALMQGRTAIDAAGRTPEQAARDVLFELAESSLERARELAPLDPDHSANLARCAVRRALETSDPVRRDRMLATAVEKYRAALELRPGSVVLLNEYGRLLINMGRREEARQVLERAVALDPLYPEPAKALELVDRVERTTEPGP